MPTIGGDSRRVEADAAITTGCGMAPVMFEALSLHDLDVAHREANLRAQYFLALCDAAHKQAVAATEHAETLVALITMKRGIIARSGEASSA